MEALIQSLKAASAQTPNDAAQPVAILWTDRDSQWQPVIPPLRRHMPQLLALIAVGTPVSQCPPHRSVNPQTELFWNLNPSH